MKGAHKRPANDNRVIPLSDLVHVQVIHLCDIRHVGRQNNQIFLHYNRFYFPEEINCIVSYVAGVYEKVYDPLRM